MSASPDLSAARRAAELDALASGEVVDVLVVGGGVTGAGVALDAASRGLSVALVERRDLATGTSRWSSKLVHGGLRYLAQRDWQVAWESACERHALLTRIAPHLVRPLPLVMPLPDGVRRTRAATLAAGLRLGDALRAAAGTSRRRLPPTRRISADEACRWAPALDATRLRGALLHWDGQLEDDARLVVALARTAAAHGARILTHAPALHVHAEGAIVRDDAPGDVITGAAAAQPAGGGIAGAAAAQPGGAVAAGDAQPAPASGAGAIGRTFELRARRVICAAGVWAGQLVDGLALRPSRGSHLLVPAGRLGDPRAGVSVALPDSSDRFVFAHPRGDGLVLVGLTDEPHAGSIPDAPAVRPDEERALLATLSTALERPLHEDDVIGRFAGLRPLLAGTDGAATADLSRRHAVLERDGVLCAIGGKLTTYRRMAQDAVDGITETPCRTATLPLVGAHGPAPARPPADVPPRLVRRYGDEAAAVAALADGQPELLAPLDPDVPTLGVELVQAVRREGALTLDDVLDRRTRIGLVPAQRAAALDAARRILSDDP